MQIQRTDLFSYTIFRSLEKDGVQDYIGTTLNQTLPLPIIMLLLNHIYYYSIDAMDIHKHASKRTTPVAGKTIDQIAPIAPSGLQVFLEADSVKIDWIPNPEIDLEKYYIYRNPILGDIQQPSSIVGTVYAPKSDFIDLDYVSATNYYYGIKAVDISGNQGPISNIANVTTQSRPLSSDITLNLYEDIQHSFSELDFPFSDADGHNLDKIIFYNTNYLNYFSYDSVLVEYSITCDDISKLAFDPILNEFGNSYATFGFKVVDSFGSASKDTSMAIINLNPVNDAPHIDSIIDLHFMEDSKNILIPISGINAGPENEIQTLSVTAFDDKVFYQHQGYSIY